MALLYVFLLHRLSSATATSLEYRTWWKSILPSAGRHTPFRILRYELRVTATKSYRADRHSQCARNSSKTSLHERTLALPFRRRRKR